MRGGVCVELQLQPRIGPLFNYSIPHLELDMNLEIDPAPGHSRY